MPLVRSEVINRGVSSVPRDYITNVVYHTVEDGILLGDVDWGNHAQQVLDCFTGASSSGPLFVALQTRHIEVKCYDMADAEPRPVKAHKVYSTATEEDSAFGPMQVALCLSFYPDRNIMGQRGRIYVGPWHKGALDNRPTLAVRAELIDLGHALFDVGGENVAHVLRHTGLQTSAKGVKPATYGPTKSGHAAGSTQVISDYWVDDSWDIVRSRQPRATTRSTLHP